jgi:hypothetical protein
LTRHNLSVRHILLRCSGFEILLGNHLVGEQILGPHQVRGVQFLLRDSLFQLSLCLIQCCLIGTRIDHVQELAGINDISLLELDVIDIAGHPRYDCDRVDGLCLGCEILPLNDLFLDRLCNLHRWRRRSLSGRLLSTPNNQQPRKGK